MIASNSHPQDVSSESSPPATIETPTESLRIADTLSEQIKSYKKFINYQQRFIFVSKCVNANVLLPSNKRHNTPPDLCLIIQQRRLKQQTSEYENARKKNLPLWKNFNDRMRQQLRNLNCSSKIHTNKSSRN